MKTTWPWIMTLALLCLPLPRPQAQESLREDVAVVNVELPVRVFLEGKPVTDLAKADFSLYEDGRRQEINGFRLVRKMIARSGENQDAAVGARAPVSRYFVLAFRVFQFNDGLQDGLKYLFAEILSPQDQLLVLINEKTRAYADLADKERIFSEIEADLRDQCHRAGKTVQTETKTFDEWIKKTQTAWQRDELWASPPTVIREFLQTYLDMMLIFKKRFMTQDIDQYYRFAEHLQKVRKEKWVLSLYQQEVLPRMNPNQEMMQIVREEISECEESPYGEYQAFAVILKQMLQRIETEAKTGVAFPIAEVSKLFVKVNATFHALFINTQMDADSRNLELRQIGSGIEANLRDLVEKTGGKLIASNNLVSSLGTLADSEDSYYVLTYSPANPKKAGKIKVQTSNKKHDVLYDDNQRTDTIREYLLKKSRENPSVRITGIALAGRKLSLRVQDFSMAKNEKEPCGWLKIRIAVTNKEEKVFFDQAKTFKACSQSFSLALDFPFLSPGQYDIIAEILDQVSGKTATEFIQPLVR